MRRWSDPDTFLDGPQILAMLTPRDRLTTSFGCANHDPASRWTIYDIRPQLCVFYPDGEPCPDCGGGRIDWNDGAGAGREGNGSA